MPLATARRRYTVVATPFGIGGWDLTVGELAGTWTVAFSDDEVEDQARLRIALDTGLDRDAFDLDVCYIRPSKVVH
jgi:hypothetical protein